MVDSFKKKNPEVLCYYCVMILFRILLGTREIVTIFIQLLPRSTSPFSKDIYIWRRPDGSVG